MLWKILQFDLTLTDLAINLRMHAFLIEYNLSLQCTAQFCLSQTKIALHKIIIWLQDEIHGPGMFVKCSSAANYCQCDSGQTMTK